MTHIPFQYYGNKRLEVPALLSYVKLEGIDTVIEPFAGSAALSFECWRRKPSLQFVVNDLNPQLIEFYSVVREEGLGRLDDYVRERLTPADFVVSAGEKAEAVEAWYYQQCVRFGRFDHSRGKRGTWPQKWPTLARNEKQQQLKGFLQCCRLNCSDWKEVVGPLTLMDSRTLVYLDPPYFSSFNQRYYGQNESHNDDGSEVDNTQMFVDIRNLLASPLRQAGVLFSINGTALIRAFFAPWVRGEYAKHYGGITKRGGVYVRNKAQHLVIYAPPR